MSELLNKFDEDLVPNHVNYSNSFTVCSKATAHNACQTVENPEKGKVVFI